MSVSILFVCLGNICRSPTAEGVFRSLVSQDDRFAVGDLVVDSAGTEAWHVGKAPDARAQKAAAARGYELKALRARQASADDFSTFDYVLAMDFDNLSELVTLSPTPYDGHLGLFLTFGSTEEQEVPDPYYGGDQGFEHVLNLVEDAGRGLLDHIHQKHFT